MPLEPHHLEHIAALLAGKNIPPRPPVHFSAEDIVAIGRPGTGGRQAARPRGSAGSLVDLLIQRYGEPDLKNNSHGHDMRFFRLDGEGDGLVCARLSARDISGGESPFLQIDPVLEMLERLDRKAYGVCVVLRGNRNIPFEHRHDYALIEVLVARGLIGWCAWREPDRIARDQTTVGRHYRWLRENNVGLLLSDLGREVDWKQDKTQILFKGVMADLGADDLKSRMSNGIRRRLLEAGKPYPGAVFIGTRMSPTGFLEEDPEQYDIIRDVFRLYVTPDAQGKARSMKDVSDELAGRGITLSQEAVAKVLADERYLTGLQSCTFEGVTYHARPIEFANPVPRAWFEQAAMRRKTLGGKNTATPHGLFALNSVKLLHDPSLCRNARANATARLAAYFRHPTDPRAWHDTSYRHVQGGGCKDLAVLAPVLEEAVISALHEFADDPFLQAAWIEAARGTAAEGKNLDGLGEDQAERLAAEVKILKTRKQVVQRDYVEQVKANSEPNDKEFAGLLNSLDAEIARLEDRLRASRSLKADPPSGPKPAPDPDAAAAFRRILSLEPPADPDARSRRVDLLRACVSRVIISEHTDGGYLVTLEGPLVSADAPLQTGLPWEKVRTKRSLSTEFVPAWRSGPRRLIQPSVWAFESLEPLLEAIRRAHESLPPGSLGSEAAMRFFEESEGIPPRRRLSDRLSWTGLPWAMLVEHAIPARELVRMGRLRDRPLRHLLIAIEIAAEVVPVDATRWIKWYEEARCLEPGLPRALTVWDRFRKHGISMRRLAAAAACGREALEAEVAHLPSDVLDVRPREVSKRYPAARTRPRFQ
jgi:hypothetical protein